MYSDLKHKQIIKLRKKREKKQRIQCILNAAKKVFFSKGFIKSTMDEIAFEAEISKATIYQYFKTKDDLYFSLVLPIFEEVSKQLRKIYYKLHTGKYSSGKVLIEDLFKGYYKSFQIDPDVFKIIHLFQQSGVLNDLNPDTIACINHKSKEHFNVARNIAKEAIDRNLIKKVNIYEFTDLIWAMITGIIQLENIKSKDKSEVKYLKTTLKLAERCIIDSFSILNK